MCLDFIERNNGTNMAEFKDVETFMDELKKILK